MPFFPGQKVVYIGPDYREHPTTIKFAVNVPLPSQVYTIRSGLMHCVVDGTPGYLLEEVRNPHVGTHGRELLIDAKFLRPVVEVKDQAFFTQGAPVDTKGLDNRHGRKQKAAAWYELKRRLTPT